MATKARDTTPDRPFSFGPIPPARPSALVFRFDETVEIRRGDRLVVDIAGEALYHQQLVRRTPKGKVVYFRAIGSRRRRRR
jgi:hypothetical protein